MLGEYLASVGHAVTTLADGKALRALREPAEVYLLDNAVDTDISGFAVRDTEYNQAVIRGSTTWALR